METFLLIAAFLIWGFLWFMLGAKMGSAAMAEHIRKKREKMIKEREDIINELIKPMTEKN